MKEFTKNIFKTTKKEKVRVYDFIILAICSLGLLFIFNVLNPVKIIKSQYCVIPLSIAGFYFILQYVFKLNKTMWEYAISKNFIKLLFADLFSLICGFCLTVFIYSYKIWYPSYFGILFFVSYTLLVFSRFVTLYLYAKLRYDKSNLDSKGANRTLIIGAGWTGNVIVNELINNPSIFEPICFLDDDYEKNKKEIMGIPIAGNTDEVKKTVKHYNINKIIFAIPSCEKYKRKSILKDCVETKCELKVVPPIHELIDKTDVIPQTRSVRIEDLLGREPWVFDKSGVCQYITGKVCLVTGGGGSIGSELCRQIASFKPKKLIILDIYENNAYDIQQELIRLYGKSLDLNVEITSITDYGKCKILFERYKPQLIFHAAAHKHVPLMETVPEQAVKNNIVGTWNLCQLAVEFKVDRFLLISTDKAVNPTNVMGASKRCCEMIVKYHSQICKDIVFCAVRFGNVLGSNGSVIPLFKKQIDNGGPITITDKRIIRYFMTIPEAVSLVLETGVLSNSGEIFVLDMGEPVKILDLAENMIKLSGLELGKDIEIKYTGLRPGEKLYEELLISGEDMSKTSNKKIFICKQIDTDENDFLPKINKLIEDAKNNNVDAVLKDFKIIVPTFNHNITGKNATPLNDKTAKHSTTEKNQKKAKQKKQETKIV